jgi:hypothetical protein
VVSSVLGVTDSVLSVDVAHPASARVAISADAAQVFLTRFIPSP